MVGMSGGRFDHHSSAVGVGGVGSSSGVLTKDVSERCIGIRGLTKRQIKLCRRNAEHMDSVRTGATMALAECQTQFANRRWNCSMIDRRTIFGNTLRPGTRESAFVHAIASAGVSHKVTRDCSAGLLSKCGCDSSFRGDSGQGFQWAGCSDNVHYGAAFSRQFVDAYERRRKNEQSQLIMLINLHNNEAGRQVGEMLRNRFDGATEVKLSLAAANSHRKRLVPTLSLYNPQTKADLVYSAPSPNYCLLTTMPAYSVIVANTQDHHEHQQMEEEIEAGVEAESEADFDREGAGEEYSASGLFKNETMTAFSSSSSSSRKRRQHLQDRHQQRHNPPRKSSSSSSSEANIRLIGTRGRRCNPESPGMDGCELLCCHRGYTTTVRRVRKKCHCKFKWCCQVKCKTCYEDVQEHTCL